MKGIDYGVKIITSRIVPPCIAAASRLCPPIKQGGKSGEPPWKVGGNMVRGKRMRGDTEYTEKHGIKGVKSYGLSVMS
jgi:hypothetical protein